MKELKYLDRYPMRPLHHCILQWPAQELTMKIRRGFQVIPIGSNTASNSGSFVDLSPIKSDPALAVPFRKLPPLVKDMRKVGPLMDFTVDIATILRPPVLDSALRRLANSPDSMMMAHVLNINSERLMNLLH